MKKLFLTTACLLLILPRIALANSDDLTSLPACQQGEPQCLNSVIEKMQRRYQPIARQCDHNALFSLQYLRTTETFKNTLDEIGYDNPASVIREDALFAEYYFRSYDAYHSGVGYVPPAWQVAFDAAQNRSVSSVGDLFLGFNAHIQRDLPFVLYDLYLQGNPVSYEDHTRVNQALQQVNTLEELAQKFDPTIANQNLPGTDPFQLIFQWRETAYQNFQLLRDASNDAARTQVAATIEGYSAASAQALRQALSYPPGTDSSARDAYCQQKSQNVSVPEPDFPPALLLLGGVWLPFKKLKLKMFVETHKDS